MQFSVQMYRDYETGRERLAVLHGPTGCFYFPKRYGRKAAQALCDRLNAI